MKKLLVISSIIAVAVAAFIFLYFNKDQNYGESIEALKSLDSYSCNVDINIKNDKQTIEYKGRQFYNKDLGYRFELNKDRILIYNKNKIFVRDLENGVKYNTSKDFDKFYKLTFIGEYINLLYTNEEIKIYTKSKDNINYEVINLIIPGNNRNASKAKLFVNKDNNKPYKLTIYDSKNNEKANVIYSNFMCNSNDDKKLFNPDDL